MSIRRNAVGLAFASATEYSLQVLIPAVLVRTLDPGTFGCYKLLWLIAGTALAWLPFFLPQSLFYFLPRYKENSTELVSNVLAYLLTIGLFMALLSSSLNPFLPETVRQVDADSRNLSAVFIGLLIVVCIFDVLPTAVGMSHIQARTTTILAILRSALLLGAALLRPSLLWLAVALVGVATCKLVVLLAFVRRYVMRVRPRLNLALFRVQICYAAPFALSHALFLMRSQGDQWIVASAVDPATYAVFSVASVLGPIGTLIRQPLHNAMLPRLNAAYASGGLDDAADLIGKSNLATSLILIPVLGGLFASTRELVSLVYTRGYGDASPIMQVYLFGMLANVLSVGHLLPALNLGKFASWNNAVCLLFSLAISYVCLRRLGLVGGALGSVLMLYIGELWAGIRVARALRVKWRQLFRYLSLYRALAAVAVSIVAALSLGRTDEGSLLAVITIKSVVYVVTYVSSFVLLGGRRDFEMMIGKKAKVLANASS